MLLALDPAGAVLPGTGLCSSLRLEPPLWGSWGGCAAPASCAWASGFFFIWGHAGSAQG